MKKIGLSLSGGGAKGIAHVEFLKTIEENHIKPEVISGTSMGALIGAMYASGMQLKEIEKLAKDFNWFELFKQIDINFKSKGLVKGKKIEKWLNRILPIDSFEQLKIPLKIVATDYWNKKEKVFESGDLIKAIRASISIPGIFEPVVIDNNTYIDGGVLNQVPYNLIRNESEYLIAIDVVSYNKPMKDHPQVPGTYETIINSLYLMNAAAENIKAKFDPPDIHVKTRSLGKFGILEFHRGKEILKSVDKEKKYLKKKIKTEIIEADQNSLVSRLFKFFKL